VRRPAASVPSAPPRLKCLVKRPLTGAAPAPTQACAIASVRRLMPGRLSGEVRPGPPRCGAAPDLHATPIQLPARRCRRCALSGPCCRRAPLDYGSRLRSRYPPVRSVGVSELRRRGERRAGRPFPGWPVLSGQCQRAVAAAHPSTRRRRALRCKHLDSAVLGEVLVKRERCFDAKTLHHRKTGRIRVGEPFVVKLPENLLGLVFIAWLDANDGEA